MGPIPNGQQEELVNDYAFLWEDAAGKTRCAWQCGTHGGGYHYGDHVPALSRAPAAPESDAELQYAYAATPEPVAIHEPPPIASPAPPPASRLHERLRAMAHWALTPNDHADRFLFVLAQSIYEVTSTQHTITLQGQQYDPGNPLPPAYAEALVKIFMKHLRPLFASVATLWPDLNAAAETRGDFLGLPRRLALDLAWHLQVAHDTTMRDETTQEAWFAWIMRANPDAKADRMAWVATVRRALDGMQQAARRLCADEEATSKELHRAAFDAIRTWVAGGGVGGEGECVVRPGPLDGFDRAAALRLAGALRRRARAAALHLVTERETERMAAALEDPARGGALGLPDEFFEALTGPSRLDTEEILHAALHEALPHRRCDGVARAPAAAAAAGAAVPVVAGGAAAAAAAAAAAVHEPPSSSGWVRVQWDN